MNGRINVSGTPVPSREREAQAETASPVITYRLAPEELERYRSMGPDKPAKRLPIPTRSQAETARQRSQEHRERKREERRERIMQPATKAKERSSRDADGVEWYAPPTIGARATSRMELRVKRTSLTITAGAADMIAPGEEHVHLAIGMRDGGLVIRRAGDGDTGVAWHRNNRSVVDGRPIGGLYCTAPALLTWLIRHGCPAGTVVPLTWDAERGMLVGRPAKEARAS